MLRSILVYFHERQIGDFLQAIIEDRKPLIDGEEGRKTVGIFTAIYRSNCINGRSSSRSSRNRAPI